MRGMMVKPPSIKLPRPFLSKRSLTLWCFARARRMKHTGQNNAVNPHTVMVRWVAAVLLRALPRTVLVLIGLLIAGLSQAGDARLGIAIEGGAFNAKFKFFNASDGCPGYNDIPGAKDYLGSVFASSTSKTKVLPTDTPIHVFLFRPRDTAGISAGGGQAEIRRRSLQVVLSGDAALVFTGFEAHRPEWTASGAIEVQRADACVAEPEVNGGDGASGEAELPDMPEDKAEDDS